jgi:hypothetical protein
MYFPRLVAALSGADFENVEVVGFGESGKIFDPRCGGGYPIAWSRTLDAEQRARLRTLIEELPDGISARCHEPPMGLRFGSGDSEVRVSLCFKCSNAYVMGTLAVFDAGSAPARQLLAFLREHAPSTWKPFGW